MEINTAAQTAKTGPKPVFRFSLSFFLGALVLNVLISPFVDQLRGGTLIGTTLMTLVLLSARLKSAARLSDDQSRREITPSGADATAF